MMESAELSWLIITASPRITFALLDVMFPPYSPALAERGLDAGRPRRPGSSRNPNSLDRLRSGIARGDKPAGAPGYRQIIAAWRSDGLLNTGQSDRAQRA